MRKILSIFFTLIALASCAVSDTQPIVDTSQSVVAGQVTVPIAVSGPVRFDATWGSPPVPPLWGFFGVTNDGDGGNSIGYNDYYMPVTNVPVGATITQVKARVASGPYNGCQVLVWRQPDFLVLDTVPLGSSNVLALNSPATTLTANFSVTTQELTQYFVTLHPTGAVSNVRCYISAAQVTYTPAP